MLEDSTGALIDEITALGVSLRVEAGRLQLRPSNLALPSDLSLRLRLATKEIVAALAGPQFERRQRVGTTIRLPAHQMDWWHEVTGSVVAANVTHVALKLTGDLDTRALKSSMQAAFSRHDLLAARGSVHAEAPLISYDGGASVSMTVIDATESAAPDPELLNDLVWSPLPEASLFRSFLIRRSSAVHLLGFVLNHFVADLWSCSTLTRDLLAEVWRSHPETPPPNPRPLQYSDYLLSLNEWLAGPGPAFRLLHWKKTMAHAPPTRLAEDYEPSGSMGMLRCARFQIDAQLRSRMQRVAANAGLTLATLTVAAKVFALSRTLRRNDLVLTILHSGRDDPGLLDMVGNTVNLFPIRLTVDDSRSFLDLMAQVADATMTAHAHLVPWRLLLHSLADVDASPVSPVVNFISRFHLRSRGTSALRPAHSKIEQLKLEPPPELGGVHWHSSHEMTLFDTGEAIEGTIKYLAERYREETVEGFLQVFVDSIARATAAPQAPLNTITS